MKERNRFDALAEELAEEAKPPEPSKPIQLNAIVAPSGKGESRFAPTVEVVRSGIIKKPNAYIVVLGFFYTVVEWSISQSAGGDALGTAAQWRMSLDIKLKVSGVVKYADMLTDQSIVLVMWTPDRDGPRYIRLEVREVNVEWSATDTDKHTEIRAYGTEVT